MAKNKKSSAKTPTPVAGAWLSIKSGIILISITSLLMAGLTAFEAVPAKGWSEGLLLSLLFGVMIWGVFFFMLFINRILRR